MEAYKVIIPVRVKHWDPHKERQSMTEPVYEEEIALRVVAHGPDDAAARVQDALSHMITRAAE